LGISYPGRVPGYTAGNIASWPGNTTPPQTACKTCQYRRSTRGRPGQTRHAPRNNPRAGPDLEKTPPGGGDPVRLVQINIPDGTRKEEHNIALQPCFLREVTGCVCRRIQPACGKKTCHRVTRVTAAATTAECSHARKPVSCAIDPCLQRIAGQAARQSLHSVAQRQDWMHLRGPHSQDQTYPCGWTLS